MKKCSGTWRVNMRAELRAAVATCRIGASGPARPSQGAAQKGPYLF